MDELFAPQRQAALSHRREPGIRAISLAVAEILRVRERGIVSPSLAAPCGDRDQPFGSFTGKGRRATRL